MEQLFNFITNGQQRRTALDELFSGLERYVPPNLRPAVETVAEMNPVQGQMNAMTAGGVVFDPDQTAEARRRAAVDMGVEMALALTPAALAARGYLTPIQGVMEGLLGSSPAQQQIAEDAGKLAADASGLARSAIQLDPDMLGEIFQRSGEARSAGAAATTPAGEVTPYADVEVIDPRDLIGAKISPTPADLTRAGTFYEGIDAAGTTRRTPLQGGPLFPLQKQYSDAEIAWLVDSASKGSTKLGKDSDFVAVTAMSPQTHQSNASIADAYMGTLEAYIQSGRLPDENVKQLNDVVSNFGKTTVDPELQKLSGFVGFDSPFFNEFMRNATFPQREAISKLMTSPKAIMPG